MTGTLFSQWLLKLDAEMKQKKRKIALLIDNCAAHKLLPVLENVEVFFFPSNCTSVLQPLDMGIIKCLKGYYRTNLVERIINNLERKVVNPHSVDIKQACDMIAVSWQRVKPEAIKNCWRKAGFSTGENEVDSNVSEDEESVEMLASALTNYGERFSESVPLPPAEEYLQVDDEIIVFPELTDENILDEIQGNQAEDGEEQEKEEEEEEQTVSQTVLTPAEAIASCEALQNFLSRVPGVPEGHLVTLDAIRALCVSHSVKKNIKQTVISDFFKS